MFFPPIYCIETPPSVDEVQTTESDSHIKDVVASSPAIKPTKDISVDSQEGRVSYMKSPVKTKNLYTLLNVVLSELSKIAVFCNIQINTYLNCAHK